jgi:hypothetical protein
MLNMHLELHRRNCTEKSNSAAYPNLKVMDDELMAYDIIHEDCK